MKCINVFVVSVNNNTILNEICNFQFVNNN